MPSITEVAQAAGVTRADVIRLLTQGGTTETDWRIAHAIEAAGGRSAYELMMLAGRDAEIARIWADSGTPAETPAPTNPHAVHDPQVHVYDEPTAPDAPQTALPDHSHSDEPESTNDSEAAEDLAASVHADLAAYARSRHVAARIVKAVAAAGSLAKARLTLYWALARHPRTSLFSLHPHPEPVALAA